MGRWSCFEDCWPSPIRSLWMANVKLLLMWMGIKRVLLLPIYWFSLYILIHDRSLQTTIRLANCFQRDQRRIKWSKALIPYFVTWHTKLSPKLISNHSTMSSRKNDRRNTLKKKNNYYFSSHLSKMLNLSYSSLHFL